MDIVSVGAIPSLCILPLPANWGTIHFICGCR